MDTRRLIFLSAVLAGCGGSDVGFEQPTDDAGSDTTSADGGSGPTLGAPCNKPGELGCQGSGQKLQLLCDGSKWISNGVCAGEQLCDPRPGPTVGSCQTPCGKSSCEGATLVTCGADRLTLERTECASAEHCKQAPGPVCAKCLSWEVRCDGATLMKCGADRQTFVVKETCANEALCNPTAGVCKEPACDVGQFRCTGDLLESCNATRSGFDPEKVCAAGMCDAVGKECDDCKAGEAICVANTPRACDSTGHWKDLATCSGTTPACKAGACVAALCVSGQTRCNVDTLETCSSSLLSYDAVKVCSAGYCNSILKQCDECKTGEISCTGNTPRECDSTFHWKNLTPCSGTTPSCKAGVCTAETTGWFDIASPASIAFAGRQEHTAIWTGSSMIVWGGKTAASAYANDGASYDPVTNVWTKLSPAPLSGRIGHAAVWTGKVMIIWGGYGATSAVDDGAIYDPVTKVWTLMATGPTARSHFASAWSTKTDELLVWGGLGPTGAVATGSRFSMTSKTWGSMAAPTGGFPARSYPGTVWTGSTMVIFGGRGCSSGYCFETIAYNPVSDGWTILAPPKSDLDARTDLVAIATGGASADATLWGGFGVLNGGSEYRNNGATYVASTSTWVGITPPSETVLADAKRSYVAAWWAAGKLYVWGGTNGSALANGAAYDPATNSWTAMPTSNAPSARAQATAVWTGTAAIVWGGTSYKQDGKMFKP